jgi:uncharacterized protein
MRYVQATNAARGTVLGTRVAVADNWWTRLRGLLGKEHLHPEDGLLLEPCRAVHMYGMRFAIDAAFLDEEGRVVAVYRNLQPGARTNRHPNARRVLELPSGMLRRTGTREGDVIVCAAGMAQEVA